MSCTIYNSYIIIYCRLTSQSTQLRLTVIVISLAEIDASLFLELDFIYIQLPVFLHPLHMSVFLLCDFQESFLPQWF